MNFRTTLFLLILVAAVAGVSYFVMNRPEKVVDTGAEHKLLSIDSSDVKRVAITSSDGTRIVLQKDGSNWKLTEPVSAPAKTFEADDLVRSLVSLQSRGQLDASKKQAGGLDKPSFVVELTTNADKTVKLSFGDKSTVGDTSYVLLDNSDRPDVVGNGIYEQLDKPASNYRDTRLVSASSDQIKQLSITHEGKTIKLEKTGENWEMTAPAKIPADTSAVTDLLSGITGLNADQFIDSPGSPAKYSLTRPNVTVWFSTKAPSMAASAPGAGEILRFGGYQDITKKNVFVSLNGSEVAVVPASAEKTFETNTLQLRNKDAVSIDPEKVSSIRILAVTHPTTQPTSRPAQTRELVIDRRQVVAPVLGPTLPTGAASAATRPSSTTQATTEPAATPPASTSKWVFASGESGPADEGQVQALIDTFHPLHVIKYMAATKIPADLYTIVIHTIPAKAGDLGQEYAFNFYDVGANAIGTYEDLTFEVDHSLIDKLKGDFKHKQAPATPPPATPGPGGV